MYAYVWLFSLKCVKGFLCIFMIFIQYRLKFMIFTGSSMQVTLFFVFHFHWWLSHCGFFVGNGLDASSDNFHTINFFWLLLIFNYIIFSRLCYFHEILCMNGLILILFQIYVFHSKFRVQQAMCVHYAWIIYWNIVMV